MRACTSFPTSVLLLLAGRFVASSSLLFLLPSSRFPGITVSSILYALFKIGLCRLSASLARLYYTPSRPVVLPGTRFLLVLHSPPATLWLEV